MRSQSDSGLDEAIPFCPVLYPTTKEFANFSEYMSRVEEEYSHEYGMVKIIPPKGWKARNSDYEESLRGLMIQGPIEQNPQGKGGVYECLHITKKSMTLEDYKRKSEKLEEVVKGKSSSEIERTFYKHIPFSPPLYGSDVQMSLFDSGVKWNLSELHSLLNDGLEKKIAGVNTSYLYFGAWKTMFAWHKEDLDLSAINYLHCGQPKFWYCLSRESSHVLETMSKNYFPESFSKCGEFLRHKTVVINPYKVAETIQASGKKGVGSITKTAQKKGEFVVVFGGAYHHGFNWGFNIAEAVNYATVSWLNLFTKAQLCKCSADNVSINRQDFLTVLLRNRPDLRNHQDVKNFADVVGAKRNDQETVAGVEQEAEEKEKKRRGRKPYDQVIIRSSSINMLSPSSSILRKGIEKTPKESASVNTVVAKRGRPRKVIQTV